MAGISQKVQSLRKANKETDITSMEVYLIKGKLHVGSVYIEKFFGVSPRQVNNWQKSGLEKSDYSIQSLKLFDLQKLMKWHSENINKNQSARTSAKRGRGEGEEEATDVNHITAEEAQRRLSIARLLEQEMKNKELSGELVRADDLDIALAEQAVIHLSQLNNDKKILPMMLEDKDREEISKILDEHYMDNVSDLHKIINKVTDTTETIIDLVNVSLEKLKNGVRMSHLMKLIKESEKVDKKNDD